MEQELQTFLTLPHDLWGWVVLVAADIAGLLAIISLIDRAKQQRLNEAHKLSQELIDGLKSKVELLESKIEEQTKIIEELKKDLLKTTTENITLKKILQGTDKESSDYRRRSEKAMLLGIETNRLVHENNKMLSGVNKNIEKLYVAIEKHLKVIEEK